MPDRRYTRSHEWVEAGTSEVRVGITDFAQGQLGDVVFLELPTAGRELVPGESFGVIESVKAASDLYAPVAGTVLESNTHLLDHPELVNEDPLGEGWLIRISLSGELPGDLLDENAYQAFIRESA